ncbi:Ig-like domain-containing protein [Finegoldia magna]|uniref:Ig-like domain-containing protein n=1 Tax=Finegoldia magna TaxID=1260 RepID=UPI0029002EA2|nr:Ig-like domain-containing protein [Finegoldia magna]MDU2220321.1 Ig-like domain-containing protein [Finegoldia magna]
MDKKNKNNVAKILLAFGVLASPMMLANQVSADNSIANTTNTNNVDATATAQSDAVTTENVIKENKEQAKKVVTNAADTNATENNKAEATEEATTTENTATDETEATSQTEEATNSEEEAVVEGKEAFTLTEAQKQALKQAGFTDAEIEGIEKEIAKHKLDDANFDAEDFLNKKLAEKKSAAEEANALGISEEKAPEAVTAEASKDISNDIINPRVSIRTENTTTSGTLEAGRGEQLTWGVSFTTPEGTKEGDTFTVKLSENMSLKGLEPDTDYALPVKFGDKIIATAKRIDRQTIQYTFTKDIEDLKYARVYIINSAQENKDVVQNSGNQTFKINVGEKAKAEKDINVDFGKLYHAETSENVNGKSQFTEFNPETGEFTQVFYLNPESKVINTSSTNDQNGREWGKVGFLLSSPHDADKPRSIDYLKDNTKIEVKKLPKGAKLPDAIIENPEGAQPATKVEGGFRNFKGEPMFTMNFGGGNKIDSPYVVVVKGHANKIDGKYTELYSNGTLYGDGEASLFLDNLYTVQENSTDSEGEKETLGYFKEHHIYITRENGEEKSRFEIPGATVSGTADEYYYTDKNDIPGYHFVKIGEGDNAPKNNPAYNDKGKITQGHFEVGKTKEVTYIYEKDITTSGSFTEHHVYEVYKDGVKQEDQTTTIDIDKTTGTEKETFKTSAKPNGTEKDPKEGFTLVKDKITKSPEIKADITGTEVTPNYINEKDLEVTYVYRKDITTAGSFTEHHVYEVYKDGELQETSNIDIDKTTGTEKETFKTSAKPNGTEKDPKEGFTFVPERTEKSLDIEEKLNGEEVSLNYINERDLEVTYVYRKDVKSWTPLEETGKFQEHHIYITKDKDGKEIKREVVNGDVTGGTKDMTYETGKKEKDGFTFVRTENPVNEPTVNEKGETTKGNFKPGVKQEITYVYEKTVKDWTPLTPAEENGSFQEHHVYEVYKDGKLVESSEITLEETTGTEEEYFTTSAKPNGTKDQPKEGFKLVKELIAKSVDVESHLTGEEIKEHYKNNEKLEVRYVYRKYITTPTTPETPWTPLEPSEPVTPVEPEEPTTPVVPDQPEEPTTPVTPETPNEDPKETPWTPLTPAEEVTPQTPNDNETPKDEPKETPKEDSKETPKDGSKENLEKPTKKQSKKLPKAGADYELLQLAAGALTLVSGMGISLSRKKRD